MSSNLNEIFKDFSEKMKNHSLPHWNDLPEIDLYMDQVIALMEKYLSDLISEEDESKLITPSMINNYVKLNIIPAPNKKKYSREHLAYLLIICSLKQVMPIPKIKELIGLKLKSCTPQDLLNNFSDLYKVTFEGVLENSTSYIDKSKDSFLDASIFLAMASSQSRFISEAILKMQKEN